jgi:3',5'-cyclic-AMP phosphodiesterase
MVTQDVATEIVTDLLRSAWIVEAARTTVYDRWAKSDPSFAESRDLVRQAVGILAETLADRERTTDDAIVEPHAAWMHSLAGEAPGEVPFADLFLARLGDWVEGHAGPFLEPAAASRIGELGTELKGTLKFPDELPSAPPFEPVAEIPVEAPGEVVLRIAILGDIHCGTKRGNTMARAAVADINAAGVDVAVQLGDLADHGARHEFDRARKILDRLEMPWYVVMGNHDVYEVAEERLAGREYFEEFFGRAPDGALVEHGGFRLALLDSVEHGASPFAPFDMVTGTFLEGTGGAVVRGSLSVPHHDLLAEVAAPGAPPAFMFLHHPTQPFTSFPPVLFGLREADSGRINAVCDSGNVWGVFAGHTHRNARTRTYGEVPVQEVGIPRDFPFGYAILDVTKHGYSYRFVQLSDQELLREGYARSGEIQRRYGLGNEQSRGFVFLAPKK